MKTNPKSEIINREIYENAFNIYSIKKEAFSTHKSDYIDTELCVQWSLLPFEFWHPYDIFDELKLCVWKRLEILI